MSEVKPKKPMTVTQKVAQLVRFLGSPVEGEAIAALCRLRELLSKNNLDVHPIADRYERGDDQPLNAAEMQRIYDAAYAKGHADGSEQGRRSAVLATAQPWHLQAPGACVDDGVNGYPWTSVAAHCFTNKHLFQGRDLEFVESIAEQLAWRGSVPTAKQAKWLRDLFMRKFGGHIT